MNHLRTKILILFALTCIVVIILFGAIRSIGRSSDLRVTFLDVGQGDAILISQGSKQILIDGGRDGGLLLERLGSFMPFWDRVIEVVVATHPDADHIGGLVPVFDAYSVGAFMWSGPGDTELSGILEKKSEQASLGIIQSGKGAEIRFPSGALLRFLHPYPGGQDTYDTNDRSIVSELTYAGHSFLFTGDLSRREEKRIVTSGRVDVLKVGHHGSKSSTSEVFLESIRPRDAVISVGKNNYGHPSDEVLGSLGRIGAEILRTDRIGSVSYTCSRGKDECEVESFLR